MFKIFFILLLSLIRYSNIFVTSPSPENLKTLFEFVFKGFDAIGYEEHTDYGMISCHSHSHSLSVVSLSLSLSVFALVVNVKHCDIVVGFHVFCGISPSSLFFSLYISD